MSSTSDRNSDASIERAWNDPLSVPPPKSRRVGVQRREVAVVLGIVFVLAALFIPTYHASHYRCILCRTLKSDYDWRGYRWCSELKPGPETQVYESLAAPGHRYRWARGRADSDRSFLTGSVTAIYDRDASPLLYVNGDAYIRLLRERHAREGSLAELEAELHAVQDAFDGKDQEAVDRLFSPFRDVVFGRAEKAKSRADSADLQSTEANSSPAQPRKSFPEGI